MADKNTFIDSAQKYLQKGQLDKAIREYYRALELDPRDVRVRHKLGELLARQGTRGEALKELGIVAEAYAREGFYLKAVAVNKQIIKLKPDLYEVHLKLGGLYQQLSLLSEAMEHYRIVAEYNEVNGTSKDCLEVYKKIVELSPDDLHSRLKLAEYYVREEKPDDAITLYQGVAAELQEKNRIDDLIRVYERLVQLSPSNLEIQKTLAGYYLEAQDARRALAKLQVCFKADPGDTETLSMLGDTFMALDQVPKAKSVYKELARIYDYQGFPDKRREIFERVRRIDPADPDAMQALGLKREPEPALVVSTAPSIAAAVSTPAIAAPVSAPSIAAPVSMPAGSSPRPAVISSTSPFVPPPVTPPAGAVVSETIPVRGPAASARPPAATPRPPAATSVAPAAAMVTGSSDGLREIPSSISKLMTEVEVYLKYNLVDKATQHLKLILEREPGCYLAHEKRRDLLVSQGNNAEAAAACQRMSMLAASAGEILQARLDLERATELDPDNSMYRHALASLSRIAPAAPPPPPPFFKASTSAHVQIEDEDVVEDDEDEVEHLSSLHLGIDESELVDDGEGVPSVYLTLAEAEVSSVSEDESDIELMVSPGMSTAGAIAVPFGAPSIAPPAHSAGAVSTGAPAPSSPAISMPFAASSVANGAAAPVASIPTNGATSPAGSIPMNGAATSSVAPPALGGGFEEFELVEDEEGMDLLRELEVELGLDAGRKNLLEPVDRATSPGELARAYFQMRLYDKALEQLELLKAHGPLDADSQWLIGRCLFQQGELADAVRCYQTVLNRNDLTTSQELEVLFDLGLAYEAQSEYNLALDLFEEIASIDETFREKEVQARLAEIAARLTSGRAGSVQTAR